MEKSELLGIIGALARLTKTQYRELAVFRAVSKSLRVKGDSTFDEIVEEHRGLPQIAVEAALFESLIDAKLPPSAEELLDEALKQWLANLPPNGLPN